MKKIKTVSAVIMIFMAIWIDLIFEYVESSTLIIAARIFIIVVLVVFLFLLNKLNMKNPFDRRISTKPYSIKENPETITISSSKAFNLDALHYSLSEVFYRYPSLDALTVSTESEYPFDWSMFLCYPGLEELSLREYKVLNSDDFDVIGAFKSLMIPKTTRKLHFFEYCDNLKSLWIPCDDIIPAFQIEGKPICVDNDFHVFISPGLIDGYSKSESWGRLRFQTASKDPVPLRFSECNPNRFLSHRMLY